jgi:cytosine/adenosine deaminase-related metal-dependent hydrolase
VVDDACAHVFLQTSPRDIDTVLVDGKVRMEGGVLAGFDARRAAAMVSESRKRILG